MPEPISHAEMIAWLRHLAALGPGVAHGDVEMAEAVVTHLERTQPTDTQAALTHALRFAIQLAEAEGYPECAAGLRVALDRLTCPDTQADLTERARALQHDGHGETPLRKRIGEFMMDGDLPEWAAEQLDQLAREQEAALQSEREAAAAEARRAAIEECADLLRRAAEISDPGSPTQQKFKVMIAETRALASPPAPQEETR